MEFVTPNSSSDTNKNKSAKIPYIERRDTYIVWKRKIRTPTLPPTIYNSNATIVNQNGKSMEYNTYTHAECVVKREKPFPNSKHSSEPLGER